MKKRNLILTVLILALVLSAGIGSAWAYFTTFATAKGGLTLHLGYQTEFEENVVQNQKVVNIRYYPGADNENEQEVYVRVRAWSPDPEKYELSAELGAGWVDGRDGWWYYTTPLGPDNLIADPLTITIGGLADPEVTPKEGDSINVAVVYECAPVMYDVDGNALPPASPSIWEQELIVKTETPAEGGN